MFPFKNVFTISFSLKNLIIKRLNYEQSFDISIRYHLVDVVVQFFFFFRFYKYFQTSLIFIYEYCTKQNKNETG